jgi:phosphoribosylformylglycinamidine cyclo-ligase
MAKKISKRGMTYKASGVDYSSMDPFKLLCQKRGARTAKNSARLEVRALEWTRGESAYQLDLSGTTIGHVEEGLGTKNLVADAMYTLTGKSYYDQIAQDTVAMIVNDMATHGLAPISIAMHLAVGDSNWFKDEKRVRDLVNGWGRACDVAGCIWAGGETPTVRDIIVPGAALLSGSAVGVEIITDRIIHPDRIQGGDSIILLESSGIHANGLTSARELAKKLPNGYLTKLPDGRTYGETLLDPTHIYCGFVERCLRAGIDIHYGVNITGHGWRKLMRAPQPFTYVIDRLPTRRAIFDFIQEHGPMSDEEAYGNLNMGAGFALFLPHSEFNLLDQVLVEMRKSGDLPFQAFDAGYIERSRVKRVVIKTKGLEFQGRTLAVR